MCVRERIPMGTLLKILLSVFHTSFGEVECYIYPRSWPTAPRGRRRRSSIGIIENQVPMVVGALGDVMRQYRVLVYVDMITQFSWRFNFDLGLTASAFVLGIRHTCPLTMG